VSRVSVRLRWRCRRGMKELDVLLERYLFTRFDAAPESERDAFARILDHEDPELLAWVLGVQDAPPQFTELLAELRRFR
jgi:antitoxin CptB